MSLNTENEDELGFGGSVLVCLLLLGLQEWRLRYYEYGTVVVTAGAVREMPAACSISDKGDDGCAVSMSQCRKAPVLVRDADCLMVETPTF